MKKLLIATLSTLIFWMSALAQLPGLAFGSGLDCQAARPVTEVKLTKSGNDIVLSWTVAPSGSYDCYVYKGIAHPEFRAEVLVATITDESGTYTDTGAITRTRQTYAINEFYTVYAVPKAYTALAFNAYGPENTHTPRNASIDAALVITNGATIECHPSGNYLSQHHNLSMTNSTKFDMDLYNMPGIGTTINMRLNPLESAPYMVTHSAYDGDVYVAAPGTDTTYTCLADELPTPTAEKTGTDVAISWSEIEYSYPGEVTAIRVIRSYLGVGGCEPNVLAATVAHNATTATDDISGVTSNWYIFYQLQLVYVDGTYSHIGASSDWIRR